MVIVFLPQEPIARSASSEPSPQSPRSSRRVRPSPPRAQDSPAETSAIDESLQRGSAPQPPTPSIDWSRESQLAAQRQVDALESARRRARGFTPSEQDRKRATPSVPTPEFDWDRSHTERIEPIPTGGMLIHLNERCVVAIVPAIIPVCALGKIEARGDLFDHMDDTPQLGDLK